MSGSIPNTEKTVRHGGERATTFGSFTVALVVACALSTSFLAASPANADIWGQTSAPVPGCIGRGVGFNILTSRVDGQWGAAAWDTFVDAAKVANDLYSLYSLGQGPGQLLQDKAVALGVPKGVAFQAAKAKWYADFFRSPFGVADTFNHIGDLLNFQGDKTVRAGDICAFSKDRPGFGGSQGPIKFTFRAGSTDDPFGHISATITNTSLPAGDIKTSGEGTRNVNASVLFDVSTLDAGVYTIEFFAKETDCNICLSILHSLILVVSDPCPNPNEICDGKVGEYATLRREQSDALAATGYVQFLQGLRRGERDALVQIKYADDECSASQGTLGRGGGEVDPAGSLGQTEGVSTGGRGISTGPARHVGPARGACGRRALEVEESLQGSCPGVALNASAAQCAALEPLKAEYDDIEARYASQFSAAINDLVCQDCCDPLLNPTGRGRDRPVLCIPDGAGDGRNIPRRDDDN